MRDNWFLKIFKPKSAYKSNTYERFSTSLNWNSESKLIQTLTPVELLTYSSAVRAFQMIANDIAKVTFQYIITKDNNRQLVENDITFLLNKRPCENLTPWEFKKVLIWNLLIHGHSPILIERDNNDKIRQLIPIHPSFVNKNDDGSITLKKTDNSKSYKIPPRSIIWIDYEIISGIEDTSFRQLFKSTISKVRENELAMLNAIKNDFSYSMFLKINNATDIRQREQANKAMQEMLEMQKREGRFAVVIDEKWDFGNAMQSVSGRIDFQTRNSIGREFASCLGIPPAKLGYDDPNKYNSSSELNRAYIDNSLKPLLINITQRLTYALCDKLSDEISYKIMDLLSIDLKALQEFAASGVNNGYITPNEVRELIGLPKHKDGDTLLANGTLTPVNILNTQPNKDGKEVDIGGNKK
ncbi:phage portal protein [Mycoplasma seminis]|uniref:Phage portal protein n=1 Tax=Mycoplasma seminis TaxID=512749 RepID=A0ABY9HAK8_9MOLU|nr:phage portal protein [Mycoplasma seminis]WLP85291.1 phage portal protein [Mycoplasma seminis]